MRHQHEIESINSGRRRSGHSLVFSGVGTDKVPTLLYSWKLLANNCNEAHKATRWGRGKTKGKGLIRKRERTNVSGKGKERTVMANMMQIPYVHVQECQNETILCN